jgi:hypothetical protein
MGSSERCAAPMIVAMSRSLSLAAMVVAIALVGLGVVMAVVERASERSREQRELVVSAQEHTSALAGYFSHARAITL